MLPESFWIQHLNATEVTRADVVESLFCSQQPKCLNAQYTESLQFGNWRDNHTNSHKLITNNLRLAPPCVGSASKHTTNVGCIIIGSNRNCWRLTWCYLDAKLCLSCFRKEGASKRKLASTSWNSSFHFWGWAIHKQTCVPEDENWCLAWAILFWVAYWRIPKHIVSVAKWSLY